MRDADAVLVSTPEYNSSIPGALKNALDWASRPAGESALMGTPAAVIGASTGMFGAVWAQAETRKVLGALGGRVLEREYPFPRAQDAFADGEPDPHPRAVGVALEDLLRELVASAEEAEEARAPPRRRRSSWAHARLVDGPKTRQISQVFGPSTLGAGRSGRPSFVPGVSWRPGQAVAATRRPGRGRCAGC